MTPLLTLLTIQGLLGALDNLWHHEIEARLPASPAARGELALHGVRELLYALVFLGIAWYRWEGAWAAVLMGILAIEIAVTLWDFVIEDRTRRLPASERVLHTVLAINFGAILALWAPHLFAWAGRPSGLVPVDHGIFSWILTLYGAGVFLWSLRNAVAVWRLGRPVWQRDPIKAREKAAPLHVLVTGGTGFIGRAVVRALIERGERVSVLSRDPSKVRYLFGRHVRALADLESLAGDTRIDGIVNLAGEPLLGGLWSAARKRRFVESRAAITRDLVALIGRLERTPRVLVSGSAIGYYGPRGDQGLTEQAPPKDHFLSELCRTWEFQARRAEALGVRVCRLRIGFVLGRGGGSFPPLAASARLGLATVLGSGRQWLSWIHLSDLVRLILFALVDQRVTGAVNATAPDPVPQARFVAALGGTLGKPVVPHVPAGLLRGLLGGLADLFLTGQKVLPAAATGLGFRFKYGHLAGALADLTGPPKPAPAAACPTGSTVYYNDACPVCRGEISHYAARLRRAPHQAAGGALAFRAIAEQPDVLAAFGLGPADIERRLYLVDQAGRLRGGIDALIEIWARTPGYQAWARLVRRPLLHGFAALVYDGLLAPSLVAWHRVRARQPR